MKFNKKIWKEIQAIWQNVVDTSFKCCEIDVEIRKINRCIDAIFSHIIGIEDKMFNRLGDEFE